MKYILLFAFSLFVLACQNPSTENPVPQSEKQDQSPDLNARSIDPNLDSAIQEYYGFENGLGNWYEKSTCCSWSTEVSKDVKRAGNNSLKMELRFGDLTFGARSELGQAPSKVREGWFGFSVQFPPSFIKDPIEESIVQWQSFPDIQQGEQWRSPPLLFGVLNDHFILETRSDASKITVAPNYTFERIDLGPVDKGQWFDWAFHIRWAYDNTGIIEVWKNNKLVVSRIGKPNCYNDPMFPYFKIGIYKWDWAHVTNTVCTSRTIYIDEVVIANQNSNLAQVSPETIKGALPVKLASFLAVKSQKTSLLSWTTTEEANTDHFSIERSKDAKVWKSIGTTKAAGESVARLRYNFTDKLPIAGANYYRLKMVDRDRTSAFSSIKYVKF